VIGEDVDELIGSLIRGERIPTDRDASIILEHIARSTFNTGRRNIPQPLRELMLQHGYPVSDPGDDLVYHWAKHVLGDKQLTPDTTATEYFEYAMDAVNHPDVRLIAQTARSGHHVTVAMIPVENVVPVIRWGPRVGTDLLVVYSADVGRIVSAYMTASTSQITSRAGTVWLRR
jgi:hypothetical protein